MNKVIEIGNVASDPEVRKTSNDITCVNFRIAVQRRFKNASGQRESDFFNVTAWRTTGDYVAKYIHKGDRVAVEGALQTRSYDAQDGSKRYITEIIADSIEGLTPRKTENTVEQAPKNDEKLPWEK